MKKLLVVATALLSIQAHANCSEFFDSGISEYNFASRHFQNGMNAYNAAVEMSRSSNPNFLAICNKLVDSVSGFSVSKDSYTKCQEAFNGAVQSCANPEDRQLALSNYNVCTENKAIADDNFTTLRVLLKNTCFKGSGTLDLGNKLQTELVEL